MAMLQRRFASSIYAVRRSLERMKDKREKILEDPEKYRQEQINKRLPEDFDDLPEDEQQEIIAELEDVVASYNPNDLREEIIELSGLIKQAQILEAAEAEVKVRHLKRSADEGAALFRSNDEAPSLHRTQGHARISSPVMARTGDRSGNFASGD